MPLRGARQYLHKQTCSRSHPVGTGPLHAPLGAKDKHGEPKLSPLLSSILGGEFRRWAIACW
jgi:hypothetical protein